jgi:Flp pilus assembly pilin Flp
LILPFPAAEKPYGILRSLTRRLDRAGRRVVSRLISRRVQAIVMTTLWRWLGAHGEDGQSLVEYSMIICLVVVVLIIILMILGNQVQNMYCNISGGLGA